MTSKSAFTTRHVRYTKHNAVNSSYLQWQLSQFSRDVGERVLEIGCGVGGIIEAIGPRELVVGLDVEAEVLDAARERLVDRDDVRLELLDVTECSDAAIAELAAERFDTIVCINALEHIRDDVLALQRMERILVPGGRVCLLAPAHLALYGRYDRLDGHYRRYSKRYLRTILLHTGFETVRMHYFNLVGAVGWWVKYRLFSGKSKERKMHGTREFEIMGRLVPVLKRIEAVVKPPFGLSLVAVLEKPNAME